MSLFEGLWCFFSLPSRAQPRFFMEALRRSGDLDQKSAELLHLGMLGVSKKTVSGDRFLDVFVAPNVETRPILDGIFKLEVGYIQNHIMW